MNFEALYIRNFRNIAELHLQPAFGLNIIEGHNGQGKTSLLEAIHLTATLRSFRGHPTKDLIRIGEERAAISTRFVIDERRRDVELELAGSRRSVKVNGDKIRQLEDYFGTIHVVTFTPDDVSVFKGSPDDRRRFFDRMVFNLVPAFGGEALRYEQALKQRNAALRQEPIDPRLLDVYDEAVAELGGAILARRRAFLADFATPLRDAFTEVFGEGHIATLSYESELADGPDFLLTLRRNRHRDIQRGYTTTGPHRDDFSACLDDVGFKNYASQGQHRALVLACKITEMRQNRDRLGSWPVLLMDDVSSELDPIRNQQLFGFLDTLQSQVFLTTTNHRVLNLPQAPTLWRMHGGELEAMDP